jgi:hypothetical protein
VVAKQTGDSGESPYIEKEKTGRLNSVFLLLNPVSDVSDGGE